MRCGTGALGAVALSAEVLGLDAKAPFRVFNHARERGVLVRPIGDGVALSPPLIATREHIDTAASAIGEALDAVAQRARRDRRGLGGRGSSGRGGREAGVCFDRRPQRDHTRPKSDRPGPEPLQPAAVDVRRSAAIA